jgi:peptidoglycan LD-endopeptidase CwlK
MDIERPPLPEVAESVIIDAAYSYEEAVLSILEKDPNCPKEILEKQVLIELVYWSFDQKLHRGQLVLDKRLEPDVRDVFSYLRSIKFPVGKAVPIAVYGWDDNRSMEDNNSVGFDYRTKTGLEVLSNHARGWAVDINPFLNPYIKGDIILPAGSTYNFDQAGTITAASEIVRIFNELGWSWGGDWQNLKDYQHFEKVLE